MNKKDTFLLNLEQLIDQNHEKWLADFKEFLSFASISSEVKSKPAMEACVEWLVDYLKTMGFHVEIWPTSGYPVIYASFNQAGPEQPTLLIYNHYDVQPVDPLEEWDSPPFEPTIRNGEIYARGAQDNKGQCFYVLQALKLLIEQTGTLPINIKLCIEGEEEVCSHGLSGILNSKKRELSADYLAIVDLGIDLPDIPAITLGTRGSMTMDMEVSTAYTDVHSGYHGGIILNPLHILVNLLDSLRDKDGQITIPGFYDNVEEMTGAERALISFNFDATEYRKITGAYPTGGEKAYTALERGWIRPTLEINGLWGGYKGDGFKTVIPAKAHAKLSCRLVPNQDPQQIGASIEKFLKEQAPEGAEVTIKLHPGQGKAVRVSPTAQVVKTFSKAYESVFGTPCQFIMQGASIPIVPELQAISEAEVILMGLGLMSDQIHAPNEHFGLDRIKKGILIMAKAIDLFKK